MFRNLILSFVLLNSFSFAAFGQAAKPPFHPIERIIQIFYKPDPKEDLGNFALVTPGKVYRGAQPNSSGIQKLQVMGIRTVLSLRNDDPQQVQRENAQAQSLGMNFINVPLSSSHRPSDTSMDAIDHVLTDPSLQPVYVHCYYGEDRTGLVIGLYQVFHNGMSAENAAKEMTDFGFKWWLIPLSDYFYDKTGYLPIP